MDIQAEHGHVDIANSIVDYLCSYRLSGQEWQVVWVVIRKTWGWNKKLDRIALSQFADMTGINRRKCHTILKKLVSKKVLTRSVSQKGDRMEISYGFNKHFDKWKLSPKKVTVPQKGNDLSPKKVTKLSPKKAHTKDNKDTIQKKEFKYPQEFSFFWEKYPNKNGKFKAFKAWEATKKVRPLLEELLKSIEDHKKTRKWQDDEGQYIPMGSTYLNGRLWEDELTIEVSTDVGQPKCRDCGKAPADGFLQDSRCQSCIDIFG